MILAPARSAEPAVVKSAMCPSMDLRACTQTQRSPRSGLLPTNVLYHMPTRIVIISDTHLYRWDEVHPDIRAAVREADIAVHCGDIVRQDVVDGMRREAARAVIVHGNSDPPDLRASLPYTEVLGVEGFRIGVTHPAWGGPEFPLEELLPDFPEPVDAILFGHFHETINEVRDGVLYLNPGQAYKSFMVPATIAVLTIADGRMTPEIITIDE